MTRGVVLAATSLALMIPAAACGPERSSPKEDTLARLRPFSPEDLTILLQARRDSRAVFEVASLDEVGEFFVPLAEVMSPDFYAGMLDEVDAARFSRQIDGSMREETSILDVDGLRSDDGAGRQGLEHWFITGIRFRPCVAPLPLPPAWLAESFDGERTLRKVICRPRIRLSVQRFGRLAGEMTSDDKAFHVIYDFVGDGATPNARRAVEDTERRAHSSVVESLRSPGGLPKAAALALVRENYTEEIVAQLASDRSAMLERVRRLRGAALTDRLALQYSDAAAHDRFKHWVATDLSREAIPVEVTGDFSQTGYAPGTQFTWVFFRMEPERKVGALLGGAVRITHLTFTVAARDAAHSIDLGHFEVFSDLPYAGIDPDFDEELTRLEQKLTAGGVPAEEIDEILSGILIDSAMIRYQSIDETQPDDARTWRVVESPDSHGRDSSSCVSCHVTTGLRERFGPAGGATASLGLYPIEGNRVFSREAVGPIATALGDQVPGGFKETWNQRAFGYYGWTASIANRVVTETKLDVELANRILP